MASEQEQNPKSNKPPNKEKPTKQQDRWTRLSVNLSPEIAEIFRFLVERKGITITEGIRRAIKIWKFLEDETARGNQIAVIEPDKTVHKVYLL